MSHSYLETGTCIRSYCRTFSNHPIERHMLAVTSDDVNICLIVLS